MAVIILAIDPGPKESAFVQYRAGGILDHQKVRNTMLLAIIRDCDDGDFQKIAIEMIASYGMAVGAETFETVFWIGRFFEAAVLRSIEPKLIYRLDVKKAICHNGAAKDPNIRQAIIDRFGGKEVAIGKKATPGPLYGISGDEWSALAVALTYAEELHA